MVNNLTPMFPMMGALIGTFLFFSLAVYVYAALALMFIAKRTNTKNPWLAWIPIANIYLMTQIGGISGWFTFLILLSFIPIVGWLAMVGITVWLWWKIAEARDKPGWWGILMLIPIVNFVIMGILAWGE